MKLGFYLMGLKGLTVLGEVLKIAETLQNISFVMAAQDHSLQKDYYEEIKQLTIDKGVRFLDKKEGFVSDELIKEADYFFAIGWRWLIKDSKNLIVLHDSLLPKYRGFNPLVTSLINGDEEIGVTALIARKEYDKGPIVGQQKVKIHYPIKIENAIEIISKKYSVLTNEVINKILSQSLVEIEQDEENASYSLWRDEDDYIINWNDDSEKIKRQIDATGFPYKGAKSNLENKFIRILNAEVIKEITISNRTPGKILNIENGFPTIVCGKGLIKLTEVRDDLTGEIVLFNKLRLRLK